VGEGFSVLIVDDHNRTRELLKTLLRAIGYADVLEAGTGAAALSLLHDEAVGLVISDYHMRPMNGLDLVNRIRADEALFDIPFILISGDDDLALVRGAARAGVDLLIKPFRPEELLAAVHRAVGRPQAAAGAAGAGKAKANAKAG